MSVIISNSRYRRFQFQVLSVAVVSLGITLIVSLRASELREAVSPIIAILLTFVPYAFGPRWLGLLQGQPSLALDERGLTYGTIGPIPWSLVKSATVRTGPFRGQVDALQAPQWEPRGIFQQLEQRRGLPLSEIDRDWRKNAQFVDYLHRYLPPQVARELFGDDG